MMQDMWLTEIWYVCVCARMLTVVKFWCVLYVIRVYCAVLVQGPLLSQQMHNTFSLKFLI